MATTEQNALAPCPFCATPAKVGESGDANFPFQVSAAHKLDCYLNGLDVMIYDNLPELEVTWNKRAHLKGPDDA